MRGRRAFACFSFNIEDAEDGISDSSIVELYVENEKR